MDAANPVSTVLAWQAAANSQNAESLLALSAEDIEIAGPRGSGRGKQLLRDWLARAGATFEPRRVFARGNSVVVEQHAVWRAPGSSDIVGEADLASSFSVEGGLVTRFKRHDSLDEALAGADLTPADEAHVDLSPG